MDINSLEALGQKPASKQFGQFRLQELINSGGMADIWVATDAAGKTFALRHLQAALKLNFVARKRFVHGCEILSKIHNHENVINYVEHGKIESLPYLLMEYVESSNLKQLMLRTDAVLVDNVADILIDMALAIEHVHDAGFMHLDFKPENLLVTRNGKVRLVDFDLAQSKPDAPKKFSKNPGTPAYMPPEQLQHQAIDHRVDIFAYGVTAYELLTSRKPFPGDSAAEILRKELSDAAVPLREFNEVPPALEKIVLKCLERDPNNRYPHASVLVRDLQDVLYVK
ncbi:MAG: serine/threonine-protein kinase [Verrucomicrobiota bacterium]